MITKRLEITAVEKMKSGTSSRPFPLSGSSIPESIAYSRESDATKDCERDSPAFRGLLHAASHSSCKQEILDSPYAFRRQTTMVMSMIWTTMM
ncbi:hypothetical protein PsorP6_009996 [Peronosclerospora sorghi]|uniref:Uncharacterized protein n=1 Tax=Peronosclerospora sorghi TaxID=230839 RepID=A0ACC0VUF3_9STRA|nr:hypothetical protein PsorP6_009996 [Peronosclerospora sorghi]